MNAMPNSGVARLTIGIDTNAAITSPAVNTSAAFCLRIALASAGGTVEQLKAQQALAAAAAEALKLATARYERGADTYLNMLDAQRTLYAAQEGLVTIKLANVSSRVTLYRALGGGA